MRALLSHLAGAWTRMLLRIVFAAQQRTYAAPTPMSAAELRTRALLADVARMESRMRVDAAERRSLATAEAAAIIHAGIDWRATWAVVRRRIDADAVN